MRRSQLRRRNSAERIRAEVDAAATAQSMYVPYKRPPTLRTHVVPVQEMDAVKRTPEPQQLYGTPYER